MLGQILSKLSRNHAYGQGMHSGSIDNCSPRGGPGGGAPNAVLCKFQTSSSPDPKEDGKLFLCIVPFMSEESKLFMTAHMVAPTGG